MSQALRMDSLSPEAVALIEQGRPKSKAEGRVADVGGGEQPHGPGVDIHPPTVGAPLSLDGEKSRRTKPARENEIIKEAGRGASVSLSIRVPSNIPDALVRASADRKIKRQRPFTQQDIAIEALTQWLSKNGYSF